MGITDWFWPYRGVNYVDDEGGKLRKVTIGDA